MIEMQTGTQTEVTCTSDAGLYASMEGDGNLVIGEPLDVSLVDANTVMVGPGHILQNGHHVWLKGSTEFTIPSGVQAQKRSNIIGIRSTKTRDEDTMETIVRSDPLVLSGEPTMDGEPTDPEFIQGNLLEGDTIADFPLYRVVTDGINALEPVPLYDVQVSAAEFQKQQQEAWDSISRTESHNIPTAANSYWQLTNCAVTVCGAVAQVEGVLKYVNAATSGYYELLSSEHIPMTTGNGYKYFETNAGVLVVNKGHVMVGKSSGATGVESPFCFTYLIDPSAR